MHRDALAGDHGVAHQFAEVAFEAALHAHAHQPAVGRLQCPHVLAAVTAHQQHAGVLCKLVRRARRAVTLQIGGRGRQGTAVVGDTPGHQPGVLQWADPDRQIEALFDQVHQVVAEVRADAQARMAGLEFRQQRRYVLPPE